MELETLKDARTEPICKVCGQPESRHADLMPLHPFEAEERSAADREAPPEDPSVAAVRAQGAIPAGEKEPPAGA